MSVVVRARIDEDVKDRAVDVLKKSGLTVSDAIRITFNRIAIDEEFILVPNATTIAAMQESRDSKNLNKAKNIKDLFEQIED